MVEECGALLGIERVIDLESPEGAEQAALDVDSCKDTLADLFHPFHLAQA